MSASATFTRTWPVGRFTCTLTLPASIEDGVHSMSVEWAPSMPKRLTAAELQQYHAGRDAVLTAWAAGTGRTLAVVDA